MDKKKLKAELKAEKKQADFEARELARKYPCTGGAEILTARPKNMPYEKYRELRKEQNRKIKKYRRYGRMIYKAVEIFKDDKGVEMRRTYPPYRRPNALNK